MKKVIVFLIFLTMLLSACSDSYKIEAGDSMSKINDRYTPYIYLNALSVYKIKENYLLTIIDSRGSIQKMAEFFPDRKCCRIQGIELIRNDDINQFINVNFNRLIEKFGHPHVDIGSGVYIPAYITEDMHLIFFHVENQTVIRVVKRDLLMNTTVDQVG